VGEHEGGRVSAFLILTDKESSGRAGRRGKGGLGRVWGTCLRHDAVYRGPVRAHAVDL
jgi:hypothetical protein